VVLEEEAAADSAAVMLAEKAVAGVRQGAQGGRRLLASRLAKAAERCWAVLKAGDSGGMPLFAAVMHAGMPHWRRGMSLCPDLTHVCLDHTMACVYIKSMFMQSN
jgi:hypothetical protein